MTKAVPVTHLHHFMLRDSLETPIPFKKKNSPGPAHGEWSPCQTQSFMINGMKLLIYWGMIWWCCYIQRKGLLASVEAFKWTSGLHDVLQGFAWCLVWPNCSSLMQVPCTKTSEMMLAKLLAETKSNQDHADQMGKNELVAKSNTRMMIFVAPRLVTGS